MNFSKMYDETQTFKVFIVIMTQKSSQLYMGTRP